jgi:hypothetical protein
MSEISSNVALDKLKILQASNALLEVSLTTSSLKLESTAKISGISGGRLELSLQSASESTAVGKLVAMRFEDGAEFTSLSGSVSKEFSSHLEIRCKDDFRLVISVRA